MLSPLKEIKRPLNGGTLVITQFAVLRAIRVGGNLATLLSPIIGGLVPGLNLDDLISGKIGDMLTSGDIQLGKAVPGALNAIGQTDPDRLVQICQELFQSSYWVDSVGAGKTDLSQPGAIDLVFGGDLGELFGAIKAVLEANNFFGLSAIGRLRGALGARKASAPPAGSIPN